MHLLISQPPLRAVLTTALLLLLASLSACTYESSSLAGLICEDEGRREGDRICKDGVWVVQAVADLPVSDMPDPVDMPDTPDLIDDMPDLDCVPEDDALFCLRQSASCGSVTALDSCGELRTVAACGACAGGEVCDGNSCMVCNPESDLTFCARLGKRCGSVSAADNCSDARENVDCGPCGVGEMCEDNQCVCEPEDDMIYCGRLGKQCGVVAQGNDNCGRPRQDVDCGLCEQGACRADNTCSICQPETTASFCARNGSRCGSKTAADNCGVMRTEQCGGCGAGETCTAANQCVCPEPMCPGSAECGVVINACNRPSQSCGSGCSAGEMCNATNVCVCPTPVCPANAQCGAVSNTCGSSVRCGANNGDCAAGLTCMGNACVCQPETTAAFCARAGATCGNKTAADNCGVMRTEQCGSCGAGQMCSAANACVCAPESDAVFCMRLGAQCGSRTAADNCGAMRTVNSCGTCVGALPVCALNQCIAACSPESDPVFCMRTNAECGSKTAADNCGASRTAECGMCSTGEACSANQCECPMPTCGANDQCGSITNACGNTVTCGDMGACSTAGLTCDPMARTCANIVLTAPGPNDDDIFGWSLALRGDLLVVGRPDADVGGQIDKGSVEVYRRDVVTNQWSHVQTLSPNDNSNMGARGAAGDYFGTSVAFDGTTLVVGAPQYNFLDPGYTGKGYVYTYTVSGNTFAFQQRLAPAGGTNTSDDARYGWSVAVSGPRLAIGAPFDDDGGKQSAGSIFTFTLSGSTWGSGAKLRLNGNRGADSTFGATVADDQFGYAIAMDGDAMVVGAPFHDPSSTNNAGVAAIYQFSSGWQRRAVFNPSDRVAEAALGFGVSLLGTRAAFGAPDGDGAQVGAGVVYIVDDLLGARGSTKLQHATPAADDLAGRAVALGADRLVSGATNRTANTFSGAGAAHLYTRSGGAWTQQAQITAPAANAAVNDRFGRAVAIDGRRVAVAAPFAGANDTGAVFIYEYP